MKITFADKSIAWLALLSGLSISAVAVYYSVAGLISIFAAAAIPIAVMGIVLELSKLVATVWLKQNWFIAPRLIKAYLLIAVAILMLITSMGIFGYLSKAHLDQAVPTGDVAAKVTLIDEKIKTERDNIEAARRALTQMDAQVDQMLGRSDTERGAERAVQIRRNQQKERASLQSDIAKSQKAIAALNVERAPIASELRKVEAEVGPIKYIAALLYGDNPDQNVLERAVRWVIILIVVIFDPLAVVLLLASQYSFQYFRRVKEEEDAAANTITSDHNVVLDRSDIVYEPVVEQQSVPTESEQVELCPKCNSKIEVAPGIGPFCPNKDCDVVDGLELAKEEVKDTLPTRSDYTSPGPCPHCGKHLIEAKGIDTYCPDSECEYNKSNDPEVDAFFDRLKEKAKAIDEGTYEADDGPLTDDQLQQIKDSVEEHSEMASDLAELEEKQEPYPFPMERPIEGSALIKETDEHVDTDAKRKWKLANPEDTIKRQRVLYDKGLIEKLPWETVEKFDSEKVGYVQNGEQNSESIWQKIKKD